MTVDHFELACRIAFAWGPGNLPIVVKVCRINPYLADLPSENQACLLSGDIGKDRSSKLSTLRISASALSLLKKLISMHA